MRHMDEETRERLWKAVLAKVEEIKAATPHRGASRRQAFINADGCSVATSLDLAMEDGSHALFWVEARAKQFRKDEHDITVERTFHSNEWFWERELADRSNAVVVQGRHYRIGAGNKSRDSSGFGGRKFVIRFHDGREVTTRDLWAQGVIPPVFRDRLPDNAVFATDAAAVSTLEGAA